ncbi:MAG: lipopolysaccharide biosynthesis protein [Acidimicrobiia bacterium]|nr:lipopolysaccharide biosynthesis protein [Acidimicrobiia bacterium]
MADIPDEPEPDAKVSVDDADPVTAGETDDAEPVTDAETVGDAELKDAAREGARWTLPGLMSQQVARMIAAILIARIIGPGDYGIVTQGVLFMTLSAIFLDLGVGAAVIQRQNLDDKDEGTAVTLNLVMATAVVAASQLLAHPLANFFETPELENVVRILSLTFLARGLTVVPLAMLVRGMRFRTLGLVEAPTAIIGAIAGVTAAVMGASYWSFVIQVVTHDALLLVVLLAIDRRGLRPGWSRRSAGDLVPFSLHMFGVQVLGFITRNGDDALVGRYRGATELGLYALSYRTILIPLQVLGNATNRLTFPAFSRLATEPLKAARYHTKVVRIVSATIFPAMTLVIVNAPLGIPLLFGDDWVGAVRPTQLLSVTAALGLISQSAHSTLVLGMGKSGWLLRWQMFTTPAHMISYVIGLHWGIVGVATALLVMAVPLHTFLVVALVGRLIPLKYGTYLRSLAPAFTASVAMAVAWSAVDAVTHWGSAGTIIVGTALACAAYVTTYRIAWPSEFRDHSSSIRLVLGRRSAA